MDADPSPAASQTNPVQLDVRDHLLVLLRRKWVVIAAVLIVGALAGIFSYLQTPVYQATSKILIQRASSTALFDPSGAQKLNADLVAEIEQQFFNGSAVKERAVQQLGYSASASATVTGRGAVMEITAKDTDPQRAAEIANAYALAYIATRRDSTIEDFAATASATQQKIDEIDRELAAMQDRGVPADTAPATTVRGAPATTTTTSAALRDSAQAASLRATRETLSKSLDQIQISQQNAQSGGPQIIVPAAVPTTPVSPNPRRDIATGLLVGLLLGIGAAFVIDFLDDSIKSRSDVELSTNGIPILAIIPHLSDWRNRQEAHVASLEQPSSPTSEAYRTLRTSVQFAGLERTIRILQVTSPRSQDGKTTTSVNLAIALARAGLRVVLVDCDLRRPRVHEFLGLSRSTGFTSVLLGETPLEAAVQSVPGVDTLQVLPAGPTPPNPSELLSGRRAADLFDQLTKSCDLVVVDTPPVLPVSDALVVADLIDAVILVVAAGSTTKKEAHRAAELLTQVDAPLIGSVMNSGSGQSGYGYGYGYGGYGGGAYGYAYGAGGKKTRKRKTAATPEPRLPADRDQASANAVVDAEASGK